VLAVRSKSQSTYLGTEQIPFFNDCYSECFTDTLYIVQIVDPKTGEEKKVVIAVDDGIRRKRKRKWPGVVARSMF